MTTSANAAIAAALGKSLWTTDSFVPRYRTGEHGPWKINPGGALIHDWGYYSGPCMLEMLPSLARRVRSASGVDGDKWETWMSLTPHEIESQELGFLHAFGNTVVMGLGMGWIAANCALNPRVTHVTIVERDADVIRLFRESGAFDSLPEPAQRKIAIVQEDALAWRPDETAPVDFLYVDIWLRLAEPQATSEVRRMQDNIRAAQIYFWGQEIAIHSAIGRSAGEITADTIDRAVKEVIKLPLLVPQDRDYARMIGQVVRNRIDRRLPVEMEI
ncbi:hypothetical protein BWI17_03690 [Betaproteobacteria bacterium GR16-43]|nr:hypothetical protein BWI17_03690 [Betaproteobacteria bacterium GR16-43]